MIADMSRRLRYMLLGACLGGLLAVFLEVIVYNWLPSLMMALMLALPCSGLTVYSPNVAGRLNL